MDYKNKSLIGFAGAPWTLLLYMIHKQSPKKNFNKNKILNDKNLLNNLIIKLEDIICLHIDKQIEAGANVIQLFDSWAGLLSRDDLNKYCYSPNLKIVNYFKQFHQISSSSQLKFMSNWTDMDRLLLKIFDKLGFQGINKFLIFIGVQR